MSKARKPLEMKEKLEKIDLELARLDGKLSESKKRLKQKSGESDTKEAKTILKKLNKKLDKKENILERGTKELEEEYEW